jgi:hypothetical protein
MTNYPPGRYQAMMSLPDEQVLHMVSNQPPVPVTPEKAAKRR